MILTIHVYTGKREYNEKSIERKKYGYHFSSKRRGRNEKIDGNDRDQLTAQLFIDLSQEIEERLRREQYEVELANQKLEQDLKVAKQSQLDEMAADVRRELARLEQNRKDMEIEMSRKQQEIEAIQREVREAESSLKKEEKPHRKTAGKKEGKGKMMSL